MKIDNKPKSQKTPKVGLFNFELFTSHETFFKPS